MITRNKLFCLILLFQPISAASPPFSSYSYSLFSYHTQEALPTLCVVQCLLCVDLRFVAACMFRNAEAGSVGQ